MLQSDGEKWTARRGSVRPCSPRFLSFLPFVLCSRIMQCLSSFARARPSARPSSFIVVKSPFVEHCVTELQLHVRFVCRQRRRHSFLPSLLRRVFTRFVCPSVRRSSNRPLLQFTTAPSRREGRLMVPLAPGRDRACLTGVSRGAGRETEREKRG